MIGCSPAGAGVGGHRGRRVARGYAGDALHPQPHGLRDAAGHAVVLERARRVEALVLERQRVEPAVLRGARRIEQRRVAFAQRNHMAAVSSRNGIISRYRQTPLCSSGALRIRRSRQMRFSCVRIERRPEIVVTSSSPPHFGQL